MRRSRSFKLILLAGSATLLQGCVAAVIPIAAGGLMGGATRNSNPDLAGVQPAADPTVIVETAAAQPAMVAQTAEPASAPGPMIAEQDALVEPDAAVPDEPVALAIVDTAPEPVSAMPPPADLAEPVEATPESAAEPVALPAPDPVPDAVVADEPPALAIADMEPQTVGIPEQPASFAEAFEAQPAPLPVETEPAQLPAPPPAIAAAPAEQPATSGAAPRVIEVDRRAAFADGVDGATRVSAAQAAAALAIVASAEEPVEAPAALARTPREPVPEAPVPAPAVPEAPGPEPTVALAVADTAPDPAPAASSVTGTDIRLVPSTRPQLPPPAVPAPSPAPEPASAPPRPLATGEFAALINYANRQQSRSAQNRASAMLADRASLQADRAPCNGNEATVLIDLDPDGDVFDPTLVERAAPGLPSALAQLRASGVKIAWISANPMNQVGSIRDALNRSGLDIENADQLLLMRYPEDRKQTRREDLANSACLVAIAGDVRTDFDELFEYLLNPEAAATLDPLMGNGWFLIPSPLATER